MNRCTGIRHECAERVPDGRHPRRRDASDIAATTLDMICRTVPRVALYLFPNGDVIRVANPKLEIDDESTPSLVGVYDAGAAHADVVADILAMAQ